MKLKAVALFRQACENGTATGCHYLGLMYRDGSGVAMDEVRAGSLFQEACEGGNASGCVNLGWMYAEGLGGLSQDEGIAAGLYEEGCESGAAIGCADLALLYYQENEPEKTKIYYQHAIRNDPANASILGEFARKLFAQGEKAYAEKILLRAEASGDISQILALELAFYRYAHISSTFDKVARIHTLLSENVRLPGWDLSANVGEAIRDGHPEPELLAAIALVISEQEGIETLSKFDVWRRVAEVK